MEKQTDRRRSFGFENHEDFTRFFIYLFIIGK